MESKHPKTTLQGCAWKLREGGRLTLPPLPPSLSFPESVPPVPSSPGSSTAATSLESAAACGGAVVPKPGEGHAARGRPQGRGGAAGTAGASSQP